MKTISSQTIQICYYNRLCNYTDTYACVKMPLLIIFSKYHCVENDFLLTLTVNSPVTASKPTWMVCSKSDGREISGRSFLLLAEGQI